MMKYTEVKNPQWVNAEHTALDCIVMFDHIGEPVPFTANPKDTEEHGREIFDRCVAGDFGPVADYVAPAAPQNTPEPAGNGEAV